MQDAAGAAPPPPHDRGALYVVRMLMSIALCKDGNGGILLLLILIRADLAAAFPACLPLVFILSPSLLFRPGCFALHHPLSSSACAPTAQRAMAGASGSSAPARGLCNTRSTCETQPPSVKNARCRRAEMALACRFRTRESAGSSAKPPHRQRICGWKPACGTHIVAAVVRSAVSSGPGGKMRVGG